MESMSWDSLIKQAEGAGGGDPIPASDYQVVVASAEAKSSSTQKPMLKVKAKVTGGPHEGRVLWTNLTLSVENDNAVAIFMRHLAAFGLDKTYLAANPNFEQVARDLLSRQAIFVVGVGSYRGVPKNEVNDIKPITGMGVVAPQVPNFAVGGVIPAPVAPAPPPVPTPTPAPVPVPQAVAPAPVAPAPAPVAPPAPSPPVPTAPAEDASTPVPPAPPF